MSKLNQTDKSQQVKIALTEIYENIALNTYTRNLPFHYKQLIRARNITSLNDAIKVIQIEEQFAYYSRTTHLPSNTVSKYTNKPDYSTQKPQQHYMSPTMSFRPQISQNQTPSQFLNRQQQFPTGPVNIQSRTHPHQRFPTNKQVFGQPPKNLNVFNKNYNTPTNRPTPMSGVSVQPRHPQQSQQYKPQSSHTSQRPNWSSQELFTLETDVPTPWTYDPFNSMSPIDTPSEQEVELETPEPQDLYAYEEVPEDFLEITPPENSQT